MSQLSVSGGSDTDRSVQERIVGLAYRLPRENRIGLDEIDSYFTDLSAARAANNQGRVHSIQRALEAEFSYFLECPPKSPGRFGWGEMLLRKGAL